MRNFPFAVTTRRPEIIKLTPLGQILRLPAMLLALAIVLVYIRVHGQAPLSAFFANPTTLATLVVVYLLSIPAHEALHVLGLGLLGNAPRGATHVRWRGLSAYTHCDVPVAASAYRAAVALPGIVLGLVPLTIGFVTGSAGLTLYGALLTGSAIGDARVLLALWRVPGNARVRFVVGQRGYEITE